MAEARCKPQAQFTEAAKHATWPRNEGESSGLPPLPQHRTKPSGTQPAWPRTPGSDPGLSLGTADAAGADPVRHASLPNHVPGAGEARLLHGAGDSRCPELRVPRAPKGAACGSRLGQLAAPFAGL